MFGLGPQELIIILVVALIIFGPKKLPEIGRSVGQGLRELKKASRDVMDSIDISDDPAPIPAPYPPRVLDGVEQTKESVENVADSHGAQ